MKHSDVLVAFTLLASLSAVAQQASVSIGSVDLKLGMTKQEVFRQFPKVFSDSGKHFATAAEIPDGDMVFVCSSAVSGTCDGAELQFHNSRLNYASKSWYTNKSAPATIAEILGALSTIAPNKKTSSCTVRYDEEHTTEGIVEKSWISCGSKGVYIARWPWSLDGKQQPEAQDVSEFIGNIDLPIRR